jgi:signal peptidase I
LAEAAEEDACGDGTPGHIKRWRETLPDGASYETLDCLDNGPLDDTNVFTVPGGHFFALGDNRDNSTDSRMSSVGYIPVDNLIGRVGLIFFSREDSPSHVRFNRIGQIVR